MYKDVLVHLDGDGAAEVRLRFALNLTRRWSSRIIGLHVTPPLDVPPVLGATSAERIAADLELREAHDAVRAEAAFHQVLGASGRPHTWNARRGDVARLICGAARFCDLVIVGQYEAYGAAERHPLPVAHSVALHSGRPTLVTPATVDPAQPLESVLVVWDSSRAAVRAVHDAMGLLALASEVIVVGLHARRLPVATRIREVERLGAHLLNHGVRVAKVEALTHERSSPQAVLQLLETGAFDLMVMGAYARPMWYEFLANGMTQSVLLEARAPILVSH